VRYLLDAHTLIWSQEPDRGQETLGKGLRRRRTKPAAASRNVTRMRRTSRESACLAVAWREQ